MVKIKSGKIAENPPIRVWADNVNTKSWGPRPSFVIFVLLTVEYLVPSAGHGLGVGAKDGTWCAFALISRFSLSSFRDTQSSVDDDGCDHVN